MWKRFEVLLYFSNTHEKERNWNLSGTLLLAWEKFSSDSHWGLSVKGINNTHNEREKE